MHEQGIDESLLKIADQIDPQLIDAERLRKDIEAGLYFASDIPYRYGLGSSGALTAGIYDGYSLHPRAVDTTTLLDHLANIESIFHGQSSGLDALVCYTDQAAWKRDQEISLIDVKAIQPPLHLYLLDSHTPRTAKAYIERFTDLVVSEAIDTAAFNHVVNDCISTFLAQPATSADISPFQELSAVQFEHLEDFMPALMHDLWHQGLEEQSYYMKLCGAGGGGYFILMSVDDQLQEVQGHPLIQVC